MPAGAQRDTYSVLLEHPGSWFSCTTDARTLIVAGRWSDAALPMSCPVAAVRLPALPPADRSAAAGASTLKRQCSAEDESGGSHNLRVDLSASAGQCTYEMGRSKAEMPQRACDMQ